MSDFFDDEADESSDEEFTASKKNHVISEDENSSSADDAEDEEGIDFKQLNNVGVLWNKRYRARKYYFHSVIFRRVHLIDAGLSGNRCESPDLNIFL